MKHNFIRACGIAGSLLLCPTAALAVTYDNSTLCSQIVNDFGSGNDSGTAAASNYIYGVFVGLDAVHTENGEYGPLASITPHGLQEDVSMIVGLCDKQPTDTVFVQAIQIYNALRGIGLAQQSASQPASP